MNKEISFFDLDGVLWNIKNDDVWIIDKDKPYKPVLILDPLEFQLIQAGKFRKENIPLDYNGNIFYISKQLFERIKKKSHSENKERFGVSFIPQVRKEIIDKRELDILTHNIEHLRYNKFIDIGLLTARSNQPNHANLLNKLRLELKKIGININKIFFVGDSDPKKKVFVLLEHLVGLKIKDNKFISIKQDWYKKVSFYDDDFNNIDHAENAQTIFEELLRKTDDEIFKIIIDRVQNFDLTLDNYLVGNNEVNRFKKSSLILKEPLRFPLDEINESYYKDLTSYEYIRNLGTSHVNVGWLDKNKEYTKGDVPVGFINKLKKSEKTNHTRGWHNCPFCGESGRNKDWYSSSEFIIKGNEKYYHAPVMIIHYIRDHGYKPPQEFIDAVMNLEEKSPITQKKIKKYQNFLNDKKI